MKKIIKSLRLCTFILLFCITFIPSSSFGANVSSEYSVLFQSLQKLINDFSKYLSTNKITPAPQNAFLAQLTPSPCSTVCSGLMGYWTFDEGSGGTATDSSGNAKTGTFAGSGGWTTGQIGGAYNNNSSSFVSLPAGSIQAGTGDLTVSVWANYQASSDYGIVIATQKSGGGGQPGYSVGYANASTIYFRVDDTGSTKSVYANNISSGWHHIVGTFVQGSSMNIYVDGVLKSSATVGIPSGNITGPNPPRIGGAAHFPAGYSDTWVPFIGYIDDVRVYNRVISSSEIFQLYTMTGGTVPPPADVNGVCGSTTNSCSVGRLSNTTDSQNQYLWKCVGENNGSTANCSSNIPTSPSDATSPDDTAPTGDTTPPTVTNTTSSSFSSGTTQVEMTVSTNEASTCKYSTTANTAYDSIANTFSTTGNTSHSKTITGLTNGTSYSYYVRCKDTAGNKTTLDRLILFSINNPNTGTATLSNILSTMSATGRPWVFLGDSITDQQIYSVYMESYFQLRYPNLNLHFRGAGRSGGSFPTFFDSSSDQQYGRWVYAWQPSAVSIMMTTNTAPSPNIWDADLRKLVADYIISKNNATPILLGPWPDNFTGGTANQLCDEYSDKIITFGNERGYLYADIFDYINSIWTANRNSGSVTNLNGGGINGIPVDAGHQNQASGLGTAYALLSKLGATGDVSSATINASTNLVESFSSALITNVVDNVYSGIDFNRKDERLPMAFDDEARTIFQIMPQVYDLNKYMLTVKNLDANSNYDIYINGENSATVNSATLASGWNMTSMTKGPIYRQLKDVLNKIRLKEGVAITTTDNKNYVRTFPWTGVHLFKSNSVAYNTSSVVSAINQTNALDVAIDIAAQPVQRSFSIRKSGAVSTDTTPPTVSITAPTAGSTVSGASVTVSASASDNVAVAGVQFKLDGVSIGTEDTTFPYSITWNASAVSIGSHVLTATARDTSSNTTTSASISVTVNNQADITPPTITNTTASTLTTGTTKVSISVTTNENATCKYSTTANTAYDSIANTFSTTGYASHSTTITGLSNGTSYTYYVRCKDSAENKTISDTVISFQVGTNSLKQNYLNALTQALHAYKNIAVKLEHPNGSTYIGWAKSRTVDGLSPVVYGGNHDAPSLEPIIDLDTQATGETGVIYAYIKAYELTKNKFFLRTAEAAGETLLSIAKENNNSGWEVDHTIGKYAAVVDNNKHSSGWINCNVWNSKCNPSFFFQNRTSLDDGVSNSVAITLIRLYEASGKTKYLDAAKNFAQSLIDLKNVKTNGQISISTLNSIFQDTVYSSTLLHKISINGKILLILNMDSKIHLSQVEYANFHYLINESDINALNLTSSKKQQLLDLYAQTHNTLYPYANGGIPQLIPIEKAYYASESSWARLCNNYFISNVNSPFNNTCPGVRYQAHKTLNDGPMQDSIQTMLLLYDKTGDQKYLNNAELQADYLVAQQQKYKMAWGPQYSVIDDSQAWGRDMEPPAVSLDITTSVIDSLLSVYSKTSDSARKTRIANSIKSAMIWEKNLTPDETTSNGSNFYYKYFAFRNPYAQYAAFGTPSFSDNYTAYFGSSNSSKQGCCWANILGEHSVKTLTSQLLDASNNLTLDKYFNYTQTNNRPYYNPNGVLGMNYINPATAYANLNKATGLWESALTYGGVNRKTSSVSSVTANSLGLIDGIKTATGTITDSDGDGYSDVVETTAGSDAYDSQSYPGSIPFDEESYPDYVSVCGNGVVNPGETFTNCPADVTHDEDLIKPTVSITTPTNNSTVSGSVNLAILASDNVGVVVVQLKLDGAIITELTTPTSGTTYSGTWNTIGVSNGTHTLTSTARDAAGNITTSASVNITVNNITVVVPGGSGATGTGGSNTDTTNSKTTSPTGTVNSNTANSNTTSPTGTFTPAVTQIPIQNNSAIQTLSTTFPRNLSLNSTGTDVKTLQIWLNSKGYTVSGTGAGSKGNETSFFGNATVSALKKLQASIKLPVTGMLDEATRKYINSQTGTTPITGTTTLSPEKLVLLASLQKQLAQLILLLQEAMIREGKTASSLPSAIPTSTPQTFVPQNLGGQATPNSLLFPRNLWVNMQDPDVKRLQLYLNSKGFTIATEGPGSPGNESDRFGNATIAALKKFQASVGVPQSGGLDEATRLKMK
jgi:hypothetical protein